MRNRLERRVRALETEGTFEQILVCIPLIANPGQFDRIRCVKPPLEWLREPGESVEAIWSRAEGEALSAAKAAAVPPAVVVLAEANPAAPWCKAAAAA